MQYRVLSLLVAVLALTLFVGIAAAQEGNTHDGIVVMAVAGKLTMTDKDGKNEHTHEVARDAKISCDGKECRLEDLKKGFQVKVTTAKQGNKEVATKIEARKA
jgi:hypothetical protein